MRIGFRNEQLFSNFFDAAKNLRGSKNLRGGVKIKFIQKGISQFPDKNRRVLSKESLQNDPLPSFVFLNHWTKSATLQHAI